MKRYHELASVTDNGRTIGYIICDTNNQLATISEKVEYASKEEFDRLVQAEEMQLLRWFRGTVEAAYTDEEQAALRKKGIKQETIEDMQEHHFDRDMQFPVRDIALAYDVRNPYVAGCVGECLKMLGQEFIKLIFVGSSEKLRVIHQQAINMLPAMDKTTTLKGSYMEMLAGAKVCQALFSANPIPVLFCTDTIKGYENVTVAIKRPFVKSMLGTDRVLEIAYAFDNLTSAYDSSANESFSQLSQYVKSGDAGEEVVKILKGLDSNRTAPTGSPSRMEF